MATTYCYSTGTSEIGEAKNFSWEYPVPDTEFWNPLGYKTGSSFLKCFSPEEIQAMDVNSKESFSKTDKFEFLLKRLQEKLKSGDDAAKPLELYEVDYEGWRKLLLSMAIIQSELGYKQKEEKLVRELAARSKEKDSLKSQHYLSLVLEERGYYAEAEKIARTVKPKLDAELGKNSPQAIGSRKIIARAIWKQGMEEEARELIAEVFALIEGMGEGKYAVYQAGNKTMLEGMVKELENWKATV